MTSQSSRAHQVVQIAGTVTIMLAVCAIASRLEAGDSPAPPLRVRSDVPAIVRLISQATQESATFRRELDAINATDGLVYVHEGSCGHGVLACLMMTVELAGPYRLLRVKLDLHRSERDTMGAIGHELQHALEVLGEPHVTTNSRIVLFYQQLAPGNLALFETQTAVRTGIDVLYELRAPVGRR